MLYCAANVTGSETLFAHCHTMWKRLTPSQRAFLQSSEAVHSNRSTAGGPAAVDSAFGLRMNASGTKRIRDATRRRRCDIILRSLCNSRREVALSCPCPDHTGTNRMTYSSLNDVSVLSLLCHVRPYDRRTWELRETRGKLCGVDEHGNGLLWSAVKVRVAD